MDITTLAAWGEFLGGIAVVVSSVYLAGQIRMNTKTVRATNFNHLIDKNEEFNTLLLDPKVSALWLRGLEEFQGLSAEDQLRFTGLMSRPMNSAQRAWNLHQQDLIDNEMFTAQARPVVTHLDNTGARQWWEINQHWWSDDFRAFVDGLMREGEAAG